MFFKLCVLEKREKVDQWAINELGSMTDDPFEQPSILGQRELLSKFVPENGNKAKINDWAVFQRSQWDLKEYLKRVFECQNDRTRAYLTMGSRLWAS